MIDWPPVMTLDDFAAACGFPNREAARKAIRKHGVPVAKLGDKILVRTSAFLAFLEKLEAEQAAKRQRNDERGDRFVRKLHGGA